MKNISSLILALLLVTSLYSQNQNLSNGNIFEGEPYLIVNPNDADHLVVAWMGWSSIVNRVKIKTRVSFDQGSTWSAVVELPHAVTGYTSADCAIAFDSNGVLYISYIDSSGTDTSPIEGGVFLCKSLDGGLSFDGPTEVLNIDVDPDRLPVDRPWIAVDNSLGANDGTIYVTTMNVDGAIPDFHPYVSISTDGGNTFEWNELDAVNWLSGNAIPRPMPTPTVNASGTFHAIYPSFVASQNPLPQFIIASSENGGDSFSYNSVFSSVTPSSGDPLPKMGYLLRSNPTNPNQLAFIYPSNTNADIDVFVRLSQDSGVTWSGAIRVNDDPIGNEVMQDLVWADFDSNGDLIVSWRDRRNGTPNTYETASEIWAAFLPAGGSAFGENFQLTSELVAYNAILASAGNDFMSIQLENGIIHATWGDPRTDVLNIWYQKALSDGTILGLQELSQGTDLQLVVYPNPATHRVALKYPDIIGYTLYDATGRPLDSQKDLPNLNQIEIEMKSYSSGTYFVRIDSDKNAITAQILKN